jgi:hypothetical protein
LTFESSLLALPQKSPKESSLCESIPRIVPKLASSLPHLGPAITLQVERVRICLCATPHVIWDKSRAQQASNLLHKPSARHVSRGLHCLINLKLFFAAELSLSATSLFTVFLTYFNPFHILISNFVIQPDGQAGKESTEYSYYLRGASGDWFLMEG